MYSYSTKPRDLKARLELGFKKLDENEVREAILSICKLVDGIIKTLMERIEKDENTTFGNLCTDWDFESKFEEDDTTISGNYDSSWKT